MATRIGRPSTLTAEIQAALVTHITAGLSFTAACRLAGVKVATASVWKLRGDAQRSDQPTWQYYADFATAIARARDAAPPPEIHTCKRCGVALTLSLSKMHVNGNYCSHHCVQQAQRKRVSISCAACGKTFERIPSHVALDKNFCSKACQKTTQQRRTIPCSSCQTLLLRKPSQIRPTGNFCSHACYGTWLTHQHAARCSVCGANVTRKRSQMQSHLIYCSQRCYQSIRHANVTIWCAHCGEAFDVWYSRWQEGVKYCSSRCYAAARRIYPDIHTARTAHLARRRARLAKAPFIEVVVRDILYARDRGICQICLQRCPKDEASCDHIIPVSLGGETSYRNCVLAHISCNARKGARASIPQQLRLFG